MPGQTNSTCSHRVTCNESAKSLRGRNPFRRALLMGVPSEYRCRQRRTRVVVFQAGDPLGGNRVAGTGQILGTYKRYYGVTTGVEGRNQ